MLFDRLLLLSRGSTVYNDSVNSVGPYFGSQGYTMPQYINPAEYVLEQVNTDFAANQELADSKLDGLFQGWEASAESEAIKQSISELKSPSTTLSLVDESDK